MVRLESHWNDFQQIYDLIQQTPPRTLTEKIFRRWKECEHRYWAIVDKTEVEPMTATATDLNREIEKAFRYGEKVRAMAKKKANKRTSRKKAY